MKNIIFFDTSMIRIDAIAILKCNQKADKPHKSKIILF